MDLNKFTQKAQQAVVNAQGQAGRQGGSEEGAEGS